MAEKVETNINKAAFILDAQYIDISWTKEKEEEYDSLRDSHFANPTVVEEARANVEEALQIYEANTGTQTKPIISKLLSMPTPKRPRSDDGAEEDVARPAGWRVSKAARAARVRVAPKKDAVMKDVEAAPKAVASRAAWTPWAYLWPTPLAGSMGPAEAMTPSGLDTVGEGSSPALRVRRVRTDPSPPSTAAAMEVESITQKPLGANSDLEYGYGSTHRAHFGTIVTLKKILEDFPVIITGWVTTDDTKIDIYEPLAVGPRRSEDTIHIENVPTFNRCLRGPGGAIYILRYIQFLDMVHDMCHARGEESNAWVKKGSTGNNSKTIFKHIVKMYVKDINWLKQQGILPYISSSLVDPDEKKTEYALFFSHICIKPIGDKAEFYNLSITFKKDGTPEYNKKDNNYVPYDKNTTLRIQYLLLIYMRIAPISSGILKISSGQSCSDFLFTNANYILKQKSEAENTPLRSMLNKIVSWVPRPRRVVVDPKIILHVDAESNKTGLCNIIPKLCDYVFSEKNKTVEYTKYFSSKEYDAALVQSSEKYIDLLSRADATRVDTEYSKTTPRYNLDLKYKGISLMSLTYTRYTNNSFYIQILRIVNYTDINKIYLDLNNKKINRNSLLYFNYLYDSDILKSISKKELVEKTFNKCKPSLLTKIKRNNIKRNAKSGIRLADFAKIYKLVLKETRDIIKLTINNAYSLDKPEDFADGLGAYNPFETSRPGVAATYKLSDNENLSITSSVRAITHGEHYNQNFVLNNSNSMIDQKAENKNRIWLKHLGDFGQTLEFYAYTKDRFDDNTIPIFLSFDKISVYLSSLFNPMTALDDLDSDSYTKIQFYAMHSTVNSRTGKVPDIKFKPSSTNDEDDDDDLYFGKVNKRNIKQKNISKRLKFMSDLDIKNKLKSVGIKITKTIRGKRKYLSRKELENKAKLFNKIQNTAKRMKIKIMYISRNGNGDRNRIYKYKTYKRLQKEIKKMKNKMKMYNSRVKNFNFG